MYDTVCLTGHRDIPADYIFPLQHMLEDEIEHLYFQGFCHYLCGGAIGYDLYAAAMVDRVHKRHDAVKLHMILPCEEQDKYFPREWKGLYHTVLEHAYDCVTLQPPGTNVSRETFLSRDRYMVDHADLCLAYCVSHHSGTYYTVRYAEKKGMQVINLADLPAWKGYRASYGVE